MTETIEDGIGTGTTGTGMIGIEIDNLVTEMVVTDTTRIDMIVMGGTGVSRNRLKGSLPKSAR